MGYTSQVKALVYPDAPEDTMKVQYEPAYYTEKYEMLKVLMKTTFGHLTCEGMWFANQFEFDDRREHLVFTAEDVKWYDSYADVIAFHKFLGGVAELGYCTEFVRIGEDVADIHYETMGNNVEYRLRVVRSIEVE